MWNFQVWLYIIIIILYQTRSEEISMPIAMQSRAFIRRGDENMWVWGRRM